MWSVYNWNEQTEWWDWLQNFKNEADALDYASFMNRNWFDTKVFYEGCNSTLLAIATRFEECS